MTKSRGGLIPALVTAVFVSACSHRADVNRIATQQNLGVEMARMSLWREATFRFKRAVQLNPSDARAHNNLAVAYEASGDFDSAAREYREALRLDRTNSYIQKNYSRYTEFISRGKKRTKGTSTPVRGNLSRPRSGSAIESDPAVPPAVVPPLVPLDPTMVPNPPEGGR